MARKRVKKSACPNCDFQFSETNNYCPNCGQENHTHKLPIKHFMGEVLEGLFHFDTKVFVTIRDLFIPGRITLNYNDNKKARYVPPVRFYIFISFVFFLLLSVSPGEKKGSAKERNKILLDLQLEEDAEDSLKAREEMIEDSLDQIEDSVETYYLKRLKEEPESDELIDSFLIAKHQDLTWYNKNFSRNIMKYRAGLISREELFHKLYKSISYSMFVLMPIFAFYLYFLYWRKGKYYSEHLIFSLHFHSLAFLLLSVWLLLSMIGVHIGVWITLLILFYFLILMKKVYLQRWLKTICKFLFLGFIYTISIFVVLLFGVIISALF